MTPQEIVQICDSNDKSHIEHLLQFLHGDLSRYSNFTFMYAAQNGNAYLVGRILEDPMINILDFEYSLYMASLRGHLDVVEKLLQDPRVDPSYKDNVLIIRVVECGCSDVVRRLLKDPRVDPTVVNNTAIIRAAVNGHLGVLICLLQDKRVEPGVDNNYALRLASSNGHTKVVKCLLQDSRVDPTIDHMRIIRGALIHGRDNVVLLLLEDQRIQRVVDIPTIIDVAKSTGNLPMVKFLQRWRHRRLMGLFKTSALLITRYHCTMRDRYAPGGAVAMELQRDFRSYIFN